MIQLNHRDSRPIYEQVKDALGKLVVSGAVRQDEKLPSVREMATTLAINPNTIQRAYRELESEGYIYTIPGKGSYVSPQSYVSNIYKESLYRQLDKTAEELLSLGEPLSSMVDRLKKLSGKEMPHRDPSKKSDENL